MKKIMIITCLCALVLGARVPGEEVNATCEVYNPGPRERVDAPVVIDLRAMKLDFTVRSALVIGPRGREIPSQLDDLDGDRVADELSFVMDVPPRGRETLKITFSPERPATAYPSRVHAQMLISDKKGKHVPVQAITIPGGSSIYNQLHHHGPAFESELVAYRLYFDRKQTVDIYGKFNKGLEIEASGFYPTDEQLARGFGDDVLRVGNSCGAGTLKGWDGTRATHVEPVATRAERVVASGPVRAVVEVEVNEWKHGGATLDMVTRYTLYAGHRDLVVEVFFRSPPGDELFCTGVQNIKGSLSFSDHAGLIACWGTDWPVNDTVKYAKETVGLATCIPARYLRSEVKDSLNYLYILAAPGEKYIRYHVTFTSLKERFGYKTPEAWFTHARAWKEELENPLEVNVARAPRTRTL
ncbi:MAG: DUF4861 domain-containing protein [Odoribacteraceae bacterium]|jgi:hypothetical protein|nr:DUF4861 domain-containing protein [Odoribacteraceae bacterium]